MKGDSIVGVFGLAGAADEPLPASQLTPHLTPRQMDVLRHLASGHSTEHIARRLGIATETVRNHVRGLLGRLHRSNGGSRVGQPMTYVIAAALAATFV